VFFFFWRYIFDCIYDEIFVLFCFLLLSFLYLFFSILL